MSSLLAPSALRDKALDGIGKLPPFSPVLTRLLASLAKDDIMVTELADSIEKDTVLTGSVMRMVNSAAYGRMGSVSSVRHAITILGTNRLRNIVLGLSVCNMMSQLKLPAGWSTKQFNLHAVAVAIMSDLVAQTAAVDYAEGAFVAGLLHDVGKLLFAVSCPEQYSVAIAEARQAGLGLYEAESGLFGFSHADLSVAVLENWKLPDPVQTAARFHHTPGDAPVQSGVLSLTMALHVSNSAVNALGMAAIPDDRPSQDPSPILATLNLPDGGERLLQSFEQEMEAMKGLV